MLIQSGLPPDVWPQACMVFAEHHNRAKRLLGSSPFKLRYGRESLVPLYPFGCLVVYLKDSGPDLYPPKFQPRGRAGIHVGYAQQRALVILDLERYSQDQLRIFVVTRDIRRPTEPYSFPVRDLLAQLAPGPWALQPPSEQWARGGSRR